MDFKQYKGKNILAWLWFDPDYYNPDKGNTVCYVYPRVLVNKFHYELIDPADFPKHGSIRVNINGGDTAEDLYERFGSFVSLKINEDDPYPNYDGNNMYSLRYNSSFGRTNSGIWIEKFSGKDFYQIIDVDSDISTLINTRSIPEPDCTIRTTLVLLRLNSKLYGPFEYDTTEGTMKLRGIKDYQYNIGEYSAVDYNDELLVITDQNDNEAVIIMPKSVLVSPEKSENRFDWISEETLIDSFIESMRVENSYAFELMDKECDCDIAEIAPFVILLDEANLSPIEHYWAAFLRNCDFGSVSNRTIPLGGSKSFKLPDHLRFLATVNFDHTTEELSPRFLDRSWVIMLEPTRIDDEVDEDIENCEDMISFAAMKAAFCIGKNDVIDEAIQNKWNAVQKIFRDHSLQIMPRNQKMVKNYCAVGCRCMERDTPATKYAPLDYAFSQKILPTINGNGENYRLLIEDLLKECTIQNMPISAKHLERMKRIAESNMGFYQFFSH